MHSSRSNRSAFEQSLQQYLSLELPNQSTFASGFNI